ncbi:disulfide bond formation protein DsbA [Serratia sp. Leaf50]|nr:disulfide bond formation protein DsbA [Serratia sp. Leaf50]
MNYRTRVAVVYLLGFFIDLINMFISNVAYPAISHHFQANVEQLAWISNGYIVGLTLVIPASRWLASRLGAKRLLLISLMTFLAATVGAGTANSLAALIGWRVVQGLGGGLLIPIGQTLTYALYPPSQRARLSAIIMLVGLLAPALSPAVGGIIADNVGWRWVFFASVPLAAVNLLLAALWLRSEKSALPVQRLDVGGLLTSSSALLLILLGLTLLGGNGTQLIGALLLMAGIAIMLFFIYRSLQKPHPLLNLRLARLPLFKISMLIYQLVPGIFTGVSLLTMLYLQNQLGMPATQVGELMLPWALAAFLAISLTGKKFNQLGPRPLFIAGCIINGCGLAGLTLIGTADDRITQIVCFALMGFGSSLCSSTAQSAAFIDIDNAQLSDASALWNINRQLSFCLGVTLMGLLYNLLSALQPASEAYRSCFALAALSTLLPIALCLRLDNCRIVARLTP